MTHPEKNSEKGSVKDLPKPEETVKKTEPELPETPKSEAKDQEKNKSKTEESLKKYQDDLNKRFTLPHEDPPQDKDEFFDFALRRMKLLEVFLSHQGLLDSIKTFMVEEEAKRQSSLQEQLELQQEAGKLIEQDKMSITEKVKAEIKAQLEDGARNLIKAEKARDKFQAKATEQMYLIAELDGLVLAYHQEEERNKKEVKLQLEMIDNLKKIVEEMQHHMNLKDGEISEKTSQIKQLKNEVDDLKGVIFKLNDVRIVLNRVFEPYNAP